MDNKLTEDKDVSFYTFEFDSVDKATFERGLAQVLDAITKREGTLKYPFIEITEE